MSNVKCNYCSSERFLYKQVGPHIGQYCLQCGKWIRWVPKSEYVKTNTSTQDLINFQNEVEKHNRRKDYEISLEEELPWD